MIDRLPFQQFKILKEKYPTKMVLVSQIDLVHGSKAAFKDHRAYIAHAFGKEGFEVIRWIHDYPSLETENPQLGLIYLANDSVINPGIEVWGIVGMSVRVKP